jgi:predicted transcriptional regulator
MFKLQNTVYPGKEECRKNKNKHEISCEMKSGRIEAAEEVLKELHLRIQKAEKLLGDISMTGSHYQVKEKIDEYFRRIRQNDQSRIKI